MVTISGDALTVGATSSQHTTPTDPNSALDGEIFQTPATLNFSGSLRRPRPSELRRNRHRRVRRQRRRRFERHELRPGRLRAVPDRHRGRRSGRHRAEPDDPAGGNPLEQRWGRGPAERHDRLDHAREWDADLTGAADCSARRRRPGSNVLDTTFSGGPFVGRATRYTIDDQGAPTSWRRPRTASRSTRTSGSAGGAGIRRRSAPSVSGSNSITGGGLPTLSRPASTTTNRHGPNWVVPTGPNVPGNAAATAPQTGFD